MYKKVCFSLFLALTLIGCTSGGAEIGESPLPQVHVFPGEQEKILISQEVIELPNCTGNAETSQTVERAHTVAYTLELGQELTVSADGHAGVPGIGQVGVGVAVATHYQVGYGRSETISRAQTVAAAPQSHVQHTIQQFEVWETGEVLIIAGDINQRLPYRFRRDFSIEAVAPANVGCPIGEAANSSPIENPPTTENPPVSPYCASIPYQHIESLQTLASVSDAISAAEDLASHRQNDYRAGETIPDNVLIATDLQSADLRQFPVIPVNNEGGWGLFLSTSEFTAPNDGTYWCLEEESGSIGSGITTSSDSDGNTSQCFRSDWESCWTYDDIARTMTWIGPTIDSFDIGQKGISLEKIRDGYIAIFSIQSSGTIETCFGSINGQEITGDCPVIYEIPPGNYQIASPGPSGGFRVSR